MMKDFDFVKFTLWMAVVLLIGVIIGDWWLGKQLVKGERDLATMKRQLTEIGRVSGQIDFLQTELDNDKFVGYEKQPHAFFQKCAEQAAMDARKDYSLAPKDPQDNPAGYRDTLFTMTFNKDREMPRRNLTALMFAVENQSPRVKVVGAKLILDPKEAELDRWKATLVFLRRDPIIRP